MGSVAQRIRDPLLDMWRVVNGYDIIIFDIVLRVNRKDGGSSTVVVSNSASVRSN